MAQDLIPIRYLNFDGLLNAGVSDFLMLNNELSACKNVWVNKIGKLEKVPGYSECTIGIPSPSSSVSPSASLSPSTSPSASPTNSPSPSTSPSVSVSPSISPSVSPSSSVSSSISPSISPSVSPSSGQIIDGESVNYLHDYYDTSTRTSYLLATSDEDSDLTLEYRTTGVWATIGSIGATWDGYATSQPDMENYFGRAFIVGYKSGTTYLPNALIDATTFKTADGTFLTDMPQGKYIVRYRDLIYILHAKVSGTVYPTRVYYCDEPSAGTIAWTNVAINFQEFGYDDGEIITGGAEALDRLVIFKTNSMWEYNESSVEKVADVGCDSNRSIQKINKILYWYNRDGFWRWQGGQPELISAKAQPFIDAMDPANPQNVVGVPYYGFEYRAFIGTVIVEGITYTNAWFCWDTRREKGYIRCTANPSKSACLYTESNTGKRRTYFGDDDGWVYKFATSMDEVFDDDGAEIDSFFITKNLDYGAPEIKKLVNQMTVFTKNAVGMKLAVDVDNKGEYNEANTQILKRNIDKLSLVANGYRYRYKFYEKGSGKSWQFEGFVINTKGVEDWQ